VGRKGILRVRECHTERLSISLMRLWVSGR
jgi:hypothetical protein